MYKYAKAFPIALILFFCTIPALGYDFISGPFAIVMHITASLIFFSYLLLEYDEEKTAFFKIDIALPLALLLIMLAAGAFNSISLFNTEAELHKIVMYLVIFMMTALLFQRETRLRLLAYWIIISAALIALLGIAKYLSFPGLARLWPKAAFACFFWDDSFSAYVTMVLPLAVSLLFCNMNISVKTLLCCASFILISAMILTSDKGGWVGLIATGFFLFIIMGYDGLLKRKFWMIILLLALFLWMVALFIGFDRVIELFVSAFLFNPERSFNVDYDTTLWTRISVWRSSAKAILRHPLLGVGLGNFELIYPQFRDATIPNLVNYAHQDYLQFIVEAGIPAFLCLIWLGFSFFKMRGVKDRFAGRSFSVGLRAGALAGCFGMAIHALYFFNFHIISNAVLFAVLCGILMALSLMEKEPKRIEKKGIIKLAHQAACAVILCYAIYLGGLLAADINYRNGVSAMDSLRLSEAEVFLNRALRYAPHNAEYHARLAELWSHRSLFEHRQKNYQRRSMDLYEKAVGLSPFDANLHLEKGIASARFGNKEDALIEFKKAMNLDPNNIFYRSIFTMYALDWEAGSN